MNNCAYPTQTFISLSHSLRRPLMAACSNSRPQNRKRHCTEEDILQDSLSSKRFKSTRKHHSYKFLLEFYDSLSKVWLTCCALRELDRHNHLKSSTCALAPATKPVYKLSTRKELQQFSRHSGPELGNLQRVRSEYIHIV